MKLLDIKFDKRGLALDKPQRVISAISRALRKAGQTALRDMTSEAVKRVRAMKRLKVAAVKKALSIRRPTKTSIDGMVFALDVSGKPVPLSAYPHRQTAKGESVSINVGKNTMIPHAFEAIMASGHEGIFKRRSKARLPIDELLGSRPADALLHKGEAEAVAERGGRSLTLTFDRLLPMELEKAK